VGAYLRWRLDDAPKYTEIEEQGAVAAAPLGEALKEYPRQTLLGFGVTLHNAVAYYIALIYMTNYMSSVDKLPQSTALWIGTSCLVVFVVLLPLMGWLSDWLGRRPLLDYLLSRLRSPWLSIFLMASSGNIALAVAAQLADDFALRALCRRLPGPLCRDLPDAGALYRVVDRLQYGGRDLWRVRAVLLLCFWCE
jgi:hypothetical protein